MSISPNIGLKQQCKVVSGVLLTIALTACSAPAFAQSAVANLSSAANSSIAIRLNVPILAQGTHPSEADQRAAAQTISDYYSAIEQQDYWRAYLFWDNEGAASQQTFEQFEQGFANTASTAVTVGEIGRIEGAAGSFYIEIPVTINAVTSNGVQQQFRGSYVLRRVNDVTGSTPEQQQWHLYSANLTQVQY